MTWRFEISNSIDPSFDVSPQTGVDFGIKWTKEDDRRYDFQKEIKDLVFIKDDFQYFFNLEKSNERCDLQTLKIYMVCGNNETLMYTGTFSMSSGKWDLDKCTVSFKVEYLDAYRCIDENEGDEVNLYDYDISNVVTRSPIYFVRVINCNDRGDCLDCSNFDTSSANGWSLIDNKTLNWVSVSAAFSLYIREEIWVECGFQPTDDWILYENCVQETFTADGETFFVDKYYRPYISTDETYKPVYIDERIFFTSGSLCAYAEIKGPALNGPRFFFRNGFKVIDVIEELLSEICPDLTVVSDFFQWNPENETTINYITQEYNPWLNLIMHQKSDVKRSNFSFSPSTIANVDFSVLLNNICRTFNCGYKIIDNQLRIEHIKWFETNLGLNLINIDINNFGELNLLKGTKRYQYDFEKLVSKEVFEFMESNNIDFVGKDIVYNKDCVSGNKIKKKQIEADLFTTDVLYILEDQTNGQGEVSLDGFALLACETTGSIRNVLGENVRVYNTIQTDAILDTGTTFNNVLSWAYLHEKLWKYGRVMPIGDMNGEETTFISVVPTIKQEPFSTILACNNLKNFNPLDKIKSILGWGYVESAELKLYECTMNLELLFDEIQDINTNINLGDFDDNFNEDFD